MRARRSSSSSSSSLQSQVNSWNAPSSFLFLFSPLFASQANTFGCHVTICGRSWQTRSCGVTLPLSWFLLRLNTLLRSLSSTIIYGNLFIFSKISYFLPLHLALCLANGESSIFLVCFPFGFLSVFHLRLYYSSATIFPPLMACCYYYFLHFTHSPFTATASLIAIFFLLFASFLLCFTGTDIHTWAFRLSFFFCVHLACIYFLPSNMLLVDTLFSLHFSPVWLLVLLGILLASLIFDVRVGFSVVSRW